MHPAHNSRPLGGANVDVAPLVGAQTEASIAAAPRGGRVLLVGTNDDSQPRFRAFTSTDGGVHWRTSLGPPLAGESSCVRGDPAVAIARDGREYAAYLVATYTTNPSTPVSCSSDLLAKLQVAVRTGPAGRWTRVRIPRNPYKLGFDDKPTIAVAPSGRVYLAWSRLFANKYETTVVSHSDDHGKTWSTPLVVDRSLDLPQLVTIGSGPRDGVYVAGVDARTGVWISRSSDGTYFVRARQVAPLRANIASGCSISAGAPLPEQSEQCSGPNPSILVMRNRVVVTYGDITQHGAQGVYAVGLDLRLRRVLFRTGRIGLSESSKANQFWPAATVDPSTGVAWLCYYDTTGSSNKRRAWFTCTASRSGRAWASPVRASAQPSLADAILADAYSAGGYAGVAADHGVAHPVWSDTRVSDNEEDVFTARISATRVLPRCCG